VLLRPGSVPFFASVQTGNGQVALNMIGVPGRTYTLQATGDLTNPQWSALSTVTVPVTIGSVQFTENLTTSNRFYRLSYP
jgi:hypothetical protein